MLNRLTPADLREAALAVNMPPFTSNVVLAAKLKELSRMSELTVWLRGHGLGGALDALEGVEKTTVTAVQSSPQVRTLETTAVSDVGAAAQAAVVGAITKASPAAGQIANEVATPFIAALEAFTLHFFQGATTTATEKPAA